MEEVRAIAQDGQQLGVMPLEQALGIARESGLDLVEISPQAKPPVCRVMDYGKYLYANSKKTQVAKRKRKQTTVKEVKFRPGTDVGDYGVKLRKLIDFLEAGNKAKVTLRFRGREMAHRELGLAMLQRVARDLAEIASVEKEAAMEGRQMAMVLGPKR